MLTEVAFWRKPRLFPPAVCLREILGMTLGPRRTSILIGAGSAPRRPWLLFLLWTFFAASFPTECPRPTALWMCTCAEDRETRAAIFGHERFMIGPSSRRFSKRKAFSTSAYLRVGIAMAAGSTLSTMMAPRFLLISAQIQRLVPTGWLRINPAASRSLRALMRRTPFRI